MVERPIPRQLPCRRDLRAPSKSGGTFALQNPNRRVCIRVHLVLKPGRGFSPRTADAIEIQRTVTQALNPLLERLISAADLPRITHAVTFNVLRAADDNRADASVGQLFSRGQVLFARGGTITIAMQSFERARKSAFRQREVHAAILHEFLHTLGMSPAFWHVQNSGVLNRRNNTPSDERFFRRWTYKDSRLGYAVYRPTGLTRPSVAVREYGRLFGIRTDFVPMQARKRSHLFSINGKERDSEYDPPRRDARGRYIPGLDIDAMGRSFPGATITNVTLGFLADQGWQVRLFSGRELVGARCFYEHKGHVKRIGIP